MTKSRIFLAAQLSVLAFSAFVGVSAAAPAIPTATIGSTTGTGPAGCVKYSKFVGFTLNAIGTGRFLTGARVYVDSKLVDVKTWALGFAQAHRPNAGKAADGSEVHGFSSVIRLGSFSAGAHTIKLLGLTANLIVRKPLGGASAFNPVTGRVTATKTIVKCASFTG